MRTLAHRAALVAGLALFCAVPLVAVAQPALAPELPSGWTPKTPVRADRDIVVAAHPAPDR